MKLTNEKTILWIGVGAREHYLVYAQQISKDYCHIVIDHFDRSQFEPDKYHCCFVFSGIQDQRDFRDLSLLQRPNVFLFLDGKSLVDCRRTHIGEIMLLDRDGFCFFTNDRFVNICLDFNLIAFTVSNNMNCTPPQKPSIKNLLSCSINEINVWTRASDFVCRIDDHCKVTAGSSVSMYVDPNVLMQDYIYIGGVTPDHLIQIFYPYSDDESIFRQYLTAMARRLGAAKTLAICNTHKPLHTQICRTEKDIEMFHINATTNSKNCSVFIMLKERDV
ncbi:hypothetical protein FWP33_08870 [Vibrio parahaemolyticus]|jgi:hypothetical protein|uniref:Uncharacterized protein n=2 Tax=Vibrio harveyi group TaxID=717610 RepID=A0A9Q3YK82_VIBPH|nr:hypothetical protein [Vibrio parahaemolyticus]ELA8176689.1 hypothetical protein [Vibrio alginolyticus]CAH1598759.1 hypothetical protein THF1C08_50233 [Vibrio jasicida]EGQ9742630.1 hypothetical protein [Vibrio parahaemolyticus]EJC7176128.1 hypothetical protein [Vibrio parahaemolyticus]EJE4724567.1 hypothetical protein [Vibrio parahaemolyticus]